MTLCKQFVLALVVLIAGLLVVSPVIAQEPGSLSVQQIEGLHKMLRPQPGESRWMEIDWYPSIWEARQKAAQEGKPIFIMAASGGAPPAGC